MEQATRGSHNNIGKARGVDLAIIAVRDDEYEAVSHRFPNEYSRHGAHRTYAMTHVPLASGKEYVIASASCIEQGPIQAQDLARDMIEDLDPQWFAVSGIAGALPDTEYSLGDVIVARRVRDFTVCSVNKAGESQLVDQGGPMSKQIQNAIATLPALRERLDDWNTPESLRIPIPAFDVDSAQTYGSAEWQQRVRDSLAARFTSEDGPRLPIVTARTVASSGTLLKNAGVAARWRKQARDIAAIEMELNGVYAAARRLHKEYPVLAVRGISDIVGLDRDDRWTAFACHAAASFLKAFILTEPIEPRSDGLRRVVIPEGRADRFVATVSGDVQGLVQGNGNVVSMNFGSRERISKE